MNGKQITGRQMQSVIIMFLLGSAYVMGDPTKTKQDTWITFILGAILELPLIFVYCAIIRKYPDDNLFEIIEKLFGKVIGKIICVMYVWYALHLCSMVIRTFTEFIHILNMPETPIIVIVSFMALLMVWGVRSGPENMGRIAKATLPIFLSFVAITFLIGLKDMDFKTINPILSVDMKTLLSSSYTTFAVPYSELILCLPLFSFLKPKENPKKILVQSLIISVIVLLMANLRSILILGVPTMQMFYYPSYEAVSVISIGEFFTRIEVLIGISIILAGFTKMCVLLFTASLGLAKICDVKDMKVFAAPCSLIIIILAIIEYKNAPDIFKWINYHQFYNLPFHVILPIILLMTAEIKTRKKKPAAPPELENIGSLE